MPNKDDAQDKPAVKSYAGIPEAEFIDNVDAHMKHAGEASAGSVLHKLEEQLQKYRFMESNLLARRKRLRQQLPDIENSLKIVRQLLEQAEAGVDANTHFLLSEQVYARAVVPPSDSVVVWLGAGCMLEYRLPEAERELDDRRSRAADELARIDHDVDFLRDQMTTVQVSVARVYNWDVKRRQTVAAATAATAVNSG